MNNPYSTPSASQPSPSASSQQQAGLVASDYAIQQMVSAKGWVRFISVLFFIATGITLITTLQTLRLLAYAPGAGLLILLIFIAYTVVTLLLGLRLTGFASAIGRLVVSRHQADLEVAMEQQMKFWRLSGILVLIMVVLSIISIIFPALAR